MSEFSGLFRNNPMILETRRMWRRFFRASANSSVNTTAIILASLIFLVFIASVWNSRTTLPPIALVIAQTVVLLLVVPSVGHGAFAGERERRSWDLLLVAPLRKSQIVAGKFVACLGAVGGTFLFFLLPFLITTACYSPASIGVDLLAQLVSFTFAILLCAMTLAISARAKRSFAALGGTIGVLVFVLGFLPALLSPVLQDNRPLYETLVMPSPFSLLSKLYGAVEKYGGMEVDNGVRWEAAAMSAVYLLIAGALLYWTVRTLQSEDGDGRFTIRRKHA